MGLFSRKKKDKEYEEEEEVDKNPKKRKRKKKEPAKPWGKKERFLVLFVIILTAGGSGLLALSAREWKLAGLPRLRLQVPRISFLQNETVTLEAENIEEIEKSKEAINKFNEITNELSGVYGLYVYNLSTNFDYGVDETETFQAASLIKLPVMVAMYKESEKGNLDLDNKYTLKNSDKVGGAGSLSNRPSGYQITYRNLIRLMGKESDNTAFNIARNLLGEEKINEVIKELGMTRTDLVSNETTPKEIGEFFADLSNGNILTEDNSKELLDYLTDTSYEAWLAKGVSDDIRIAHKYGRETHVVNDAGIVFSEEPYVVVIMSKGVVERQADETFPIISEIVYAVQTGE